VKKYRYVIVNSLGYSYDTLREESFTSGGLGGTSYYDLPELLLKGWVPVRETPMGTHGQGHLAFSLVLLEKESTGGSGPLLAEPAGD
jgi:hypothetical protein